MMSRWAGLTITLESCWIKQSRTTFIHYNMIIYDYDIGLYIAGSPERVILY